MGRFQVKLYREHQNFNYWVKNEQQRVPCNLLPWRKQVVPTALHSSSNTSPLKPPSCCGLEHFIPPSAMPGICLKGSSSLTTFLGHSSALALSALALPHKAKLPQGRDQQERSDAVTGRCYRPMSDRLFVSAGLSWRCLDAFIQVDIHLSDKLHPWKGQRQVYGSVMLFAALSSTPQGRRTAAAQAAPQAAAGRAVPGSAWQLWVSWTLVMGQSCRWLPPCALLTFHLD